MKDEGEDTMNYQHYSPEFKVKVVLQVLQGETEIGELAQEYSINPNLIRKWKTEFLEKEKQQMLRTIGQLTLERDFIQDAFRRCGLPVPQFNPKDE